MSLGLLAHPRRYLTRNMIGTERDERTKVAENQSTLLFLCKISCTNVLTYLAIFVRILFGHSGSFSEANRLQAPRSVFRMGGLFCFWCYPP